MGTTASLTKLQGTFEEVHDFAFGYDIIRTCEKELNKFKKKGLKAVPVSPSIRTAPFRSVRLKSRRATT